MRPPSADRSAWVPPRPPPPNIRGTEAWSANVKRGGAADFAFLISSKGLTLLLAQICMGHRASY